MERFHFRVTHSNEPSAFHSIFHYLEDNTIIKDKAGKKMLIYTRK